MVVYTMTLDLVELIVWGGGATSYSVQDLEKGYEICNLVRDPLLYKGLHLQVAKESSL
jgi:hypothetical protein